MYTATFTFRKRRFDDDFDRLDAAIAQAAQAIPGYLGEQAWQSSDGERVSTVYYWQSLEALHALMHHPAHLEAKAAQSRWLAGYQVVVGEVLRVYGDDGLSPVDRIRLVRE